MVDERLEPSGDVAGCREVREVGASPVPVVVMEALHGGALDAAVHSLDLAVGPGIVGLGAPLLYAIRVTDHIEAHRSGEDRVSMPRPLRELDAIVGAKGVDLPGNNLDHVLQVLPSAAPVSLPDALADRELAGAVDTDKKTEPALGGLHLGHVDVEDADRVALELLARLPVAADIGQTRDAMPLQAAVKG